MLDAQAQQTFGVTHNIPNHGIWNFSPVRIIARKELCVEKGTFELHNCKGVDRASDGTTNWVIQVATCIFVWSNLIIINSSGWRTLSDEGGLHNCQCNLCDCGTKTKKTPTVTYKLEHMYMTCMLPQPGAYFDRTLRRASVVFLEYLAMPKDKMSQPLIYKY